MGGMQLTTGWTATVEELVEAQRRLAEQAPPVWQVPGAPVTAGCFVCFPRGYEGAGETGDPGWAAASCFRGRRRVAEAVVTGHAGGPYLPGLLALRAGALLDAAVRALPAPPDVVLVDGTGYDHPQRAGLARHLGAAVDLPTVGVTHRPLLATGDWPADEWGAISELRLDGMLVAYWVRTRAGCRPLAVHAGWRTDAATAVRTVLAVAWHRTPAPLRDARRLARTARAGDRGRCGTASRWAPG